VRHRNFEVGVPPSKVRHSAKNQRCRTLELRRRTSEPRRRTFEVGPPTSGVGGSRPSGEGISKEKQAATRISRVAALSKPVIYRKFTEPPLGLVCLGHWRLVQIALPALSPEL
jgi:hypothetical protein